MKYKIQIPEKIIEESFNIALAKNRRDRGNFFYEVREAFKLKLEELLSENNIKVNSTDSLRSTNSFKKAKVVKGNNSIDTQFCMRYGHTEYSLTAINYLSSPHKDLPSLRSFVKTKSFSLGNILILVENENYDIELKFPNEVQFSGYATDISKRKMKSYICILGITFEQAILEKIYETISKGYVAIEKDFDEIMVAPYPMIYINRINGELRTCSCFKGKYDIGRDILRLSKPYQKLDDHIKKITTLDNLCNLCNGGVPKFEYGRYVGYSTFLHRYGAYHKLFSLKQYGKDIYVSDPEFRDIEDQVREYFDYPKIGERWLSETMLFKIVCSLYPDLEVIHHYRGDELDKLELDIWIPQKKIGIEYQGEQHYIEIEHWGGEEGLIKRKQNDARKKELCENLGYTLIEFKYSEKLTEENVKRKLSLHIK